MNYYIIPIVIVLVVLFLLLRDDHERTYDKKDNPKKPEAKPNPVYEPVKEHKEEVVDNDRAVLAFLDTLTYYSDLEKKTDTFDLYDFSRQLTEKDCGPIIGTVHTCEYNYIDDPYIAASRVDGEYLGSIPESQEKAYYALNKREVTCPFVGKVEMDTDGELIAEIKVILPVDKEFVVREMKVEKGDFPIFDKASLRLPPAPKPPKAQSSGPETPSPRPTPHDSPEDLDYWLFYYDSRFVRDSPIEYATRMRNQYLKEHGHPIPKEKEPGD